MSCWAQHRPIAPSPRRGEGRGEGGALVDWNEWWGDVNGKVINARFWNNDVLENIDGVLEEIMSVLNRQASDPPHPDPLPAGEREKGACGNV
jgi:hypothetical protein